MLRHLMAIGPGFFTFLSGVMVSVSMTAITQVVFAIKIPPNYPTLVVSGLIALTAGVCWFILGEQLQGLRERFSRLLGIGTKPEDAFSQVLEGRRIFLHGTSIIALFCSLAWMFVDYLMHY